MSSKALQFTIFLSIVLSLISFWDHPILDYTKEFVVLVHEICHAVAALMTGGDVKNIVIHGNESGETIAIPPNIKGAFLFIVSAGYLGTAMIGGILLYKGFQGENTKTTLILFGIVVFFITMKYTETQDLTYRIGIVWSVSILCSAFLGKSISSLALVFLGTSISLYSIYDLSDFSENVQSTDAGILAYHLTGYKPSPNNPIPPSVLILGHLIAIAWSLISVGTIYKFLIRSIHHGNETHDETIPEYEGMENFLPDEANQMFPGELTPEVVEWFLSRGLDLNGQPLPNIDQELVDGIQKDSEMS